MNLRLTFPTMPPASIICVCTFLEPGFQSSSVAIAALPRVRSSVSVTFSHMCKVNT